MTKKTLKNLKTIKLDYPITYEGTDITELTMKLRRLKVKDQLRVSDLESEAEKEVALFAGMCDQPQACLEELDLVDYARLQEAYQEMTIDPKSSASK